MPGEILCTCGAVLVEEVTDAGVRPVGSDQLVRFRRTTDYVMCAWCLMTHDVRSLITRARDTDIIEYLERMAEEASLGEGAGR